MARRLLVAALLAAGLAACGGEEPAPPGGAARTPDSLPQGLLLALSQFEVDAQGKVLPKPGPARLEILVREDGLWRVRVLDDPESNVFHKAMVYTPPGGAPGILTLGGSEAAVKLWRKGERGFEAETLWKKDWGGKFSRMRDVERVDAGGALAVATHDQGVVGLIEPRAQGGYEVRELDHEADTFVHEIEVGDLDADGALEIYATPSEPNRLDGTPQPGKVVRYVPSAGQGRTVVADLGNRHAKEILVEDVDGDGTDELYVAVEGETVGRGDAQRLLHPVEIRRYDAGTPADASVVVARIQDRLCRFLTAGDVDGDGRKELVAASFRAGVWLLRPGEDPRRPWSMQAIDRESGGFEHAALLADLDGDGRDELYVASDNDGEVRRYVWGEGAEPSREVIHGRTPASSAFTWNLMPVPVELVPPPVELVP
jgi:hypothetical protein